MVCQLNKITLILIGKFTKNQVGQFNKKKFLAYQLVGQFIKKQVIALPLVGQIKKQVLALSLVLNLLKNKFLLFDYYRLVNILKNNRFLPSHGLVSLLTIQFLAFMVCLLTCHWLLFSGLPLVDPL